MIAYGLYDFPFTCGQVCAAFFLSLGLIVLAVVILIRRSHKRKGSRWP
jgi:hypothetical protein